MRLASAAVALVVACHPAPAPEAPPPAPRPPPPAAPVVASPAPSAATAAPEAPDVWSGASEPATEDAAPVMVDGRVDGAALRQRNLARLERDAPWPVVVHTGTSAYELGRSICEAVVPKRGPEVPVLVKPNVCGFQALAKKTRPDDDDGLKGRITDPEFTRGVIHCLKARGHTAITLAEGCAIPHSMFQKVMRLSGYAALAEEEDVPLVGMDDDGVFDARRGPGDPIAVDGMKDSHVPTLLLPKILVEHLDHGLFISVPKLKAHRFSVVSGGIKGTQGVVMRSDAAPAHRQKWRMHQELHRYLHRMKNGLEERDAYVKALEVFSERVLDAMEVAMPDAVLLDGAPMMAGDGFDLLVPRAELVAVGGTHPVRVDQVASQLLGLWNHPTLERELGGYGGSPLILLAAKRWNVDPATTKTTGPGASLLSTPRPTTYQAMAPIAIGLDE